MPASTSAFSASLHPCGVALAIWLCAHSLFALQPPIGPLLGAISFWLVRYATAKSCKSSSAPLFPPIHFPQSALNFSLFRLRLSLGKTGFATRAAGAPCVGAAAWIATRTLLLRNVTLALSQLRGFAPQNACLSCRFAPAQAVVFWHTCAGARRIRSCPRCRHSPARSFAA